MQKNPETTQDRTDPMIGSDNVNLLNEALARAHSREVYDQAQERLQASRIVSARRLERKAARAALRARRLAAAAFAASDHAA